LENLYDIGAQNFLRNLAVKEFCNSVYIYRSYDQKSNVFLRHSVGLGGKSNR